MTEFAEEGEAAAYRSSFHKRTFDAIDLDADDELYDPITHLHHPSSTRKRTVEDDDEFVKSKPQGPSEKLTERKKTKKGKEKKKSKGKAMKDASDFTVNPSLGATNITTTTDKPAANPVTGSATKPSLSETAVTTAKDLPTILDSAEPNLIKNPNVPSPAPAKPTASDNLEETSITDTPTLSSPTPTAPSLATPTPAPAPAAPPSGPPAIRGLTRSRTMTTSTDRAAQRAAQGGGAQGMQNVTGIKQSTADTHDPMLYLMLDQLQQQ